MLLRNEYANYYHVTFVQGSNFIWHADGYDKLKSYGFAIHGCIDTTTENTTKQ